MDKIVNPFVFSGTHNSRLSPPPPPATAEWPPADLNYLLSRHFMPGGHGAGKNRAQHIFGGGGG
jgi:hypothetical protein